MSQRDLRLTGENLTRRRVAQLVTYVGAGFIQGREAENSKRETVYFDDPKALRWDIAGALAKIFGLNVMFTIAGRIYALVADTQFIPNDGYKKLVDFWDAATPDVYDLAMHRLRAYAG